MPQISVIIPNYNHAAYLKQRIDSVLNQTFQDFELIILDDCSKDESRSIIELYRNHPMVSNIIYNEVNSGSTFKQWEKGISLAKGDWIWIAESDDHCDKTLLFELVKIVNQDRDVVISYSQSYQIDESGVILGNLNFYTDPLDLHHWKTDYINNGRNEIKDFLLYRNTIPNASAVIFKKSAYLEVSKSFVEMKLCGDWMLWVQLLKIGKVAFCAKPLNYFRTHGATTRVLNNNQKVRLRLREENKIALDISKSFSSNETYLFTARLNDIASQYGLNYISNGLLHLIVNSIPFLKTSSLYHLIKLCLGLVFKTFLRRKSG